MVINNFVDYSYSCNKQIKYNSATNAYENSKYLFCMDIYKNDADDDAVVTLNFSTINDIVKFRDGVNAFLKFSEGMID